MSDDPFGLRSLDVETLRQKRCHKWAAARDGYAAWVADMDFPVAPAIRDALRDVIDRDELGYPDWGGIEVLSPAATLFAQRMADRYRWQPALDRVPDLADVVQGGELLRLRDRGGAGEPLVGGAVIHRPHSGIGVRLFGVAGDLVARIAEVADDEVVLREACIEESLQPAVVLHPLGERIADDANVIAGPEFQAARRLSGIGGVE